jgi:hypothetical protein
MILLLAQTNVDHRRANEITAFLARLSADDPKSLCAAQEYLRPRLSDLKPSGRSTAFFALWDFYDQTVRLNQTRVEQIGQGLSPQEYDLVTSGLRMAGAKDRDAQLRATSPRAWRAIEPWLHCGYVIGVDFDQTLALDPNPWFLRALQSVLDSSDRDYLNLFLAESPYSLDHDGALAVPWDRLRSRIAKWERFRAENVKNPQLVQHIDRQLKTMFQYYLCGMPNSEPFGATGELSSELRESYLNFLKLNSGSREYTTIESAIKLLQQNNWKINQAVIQLYRSKGYSIDLLEDEWNRITR